MVKIDGNTISMTRGDTLSAVITIMQGNTPYTPVEGDVIRFALKSPRYEVGGGNFVETEPLIRKVIPNDSLILNLTPADTKGLEFGGYKYDIEITFAGGEVDTFIPLADFILTAEVD